MYINNFYTHYTNKFAIFIIGINTKKFSLKTFNPGIKGHAAEAKKMAIAFLFNN